MESSTRDTNQLWMKSRIIIIGARIIIMMTSLYIHTDTACMGIYISYSHNYSIKRLKQYAAAGRDMHTAV